MFAQVRLRDQGAILDFDATDLRRQPPLDTTWHQVDAADLIFCVPVFASDDIQFQLISGSLIVDRLHS